MNKENVFHQKKVRNMGTILAVIIWLSIAVYMVGIMAIGLFMRTAGDFGSQIELPPGITLETTVGELIAADNQFMQHHLIQFSTHFFLALLFFTVVSVLLLRIAFAWRRSEPFLRTAVLGFRWLGILMLGQVLFGLIYASLVPDSLSGVLLNSMIYDIALNLLCGQYGSNFTFAIVFLTLSWVLEHGRVLKDEQDLTV